MRDKAAELADSLSSLRAILPDNHEGNITSSIMPFPIAPPLEPMLAKIAEHLPLDGDFLFEPKWDGFRAIVFRSDDNVYIQSRDLKPFDRYFPELHQSLLGLLPADCVVDGEIVIVTTSGLDFDALQLRLHPAESRIAKLAKESPASFVAFDLLAVDGKNVMAARQSDRRAMLEALLEGAKPPLHLTPMTRQRRLASDWLQQFEGAGLDGIIVKPVDSPYLAGKRAMLKVKHVRTADCVVAGFRWYKETRDAVGSLLLGLYDDHGVLHHVGVTSAFTMATRRSLAQALEPLRQNAMDEHPWREWTSEGSHATTRMPGGQSRWSAGKDLSWEALRIDRVCEVKYDHLQGDRFRHATHFLRWRPDKPPAACRYDQLEVTTPYALKRVFGAVGRKRR
jgi:ATP-dependent DNA ligase